MADEIRTYAKIPRFKIDWKGLFATIRFSSPEANEAKPQYSVDDFEGDSAAGGGRLWD